MRPSTGNDTLRGATRLLLLALAFALAVAGPLPGAAAAPPAETETPGARLDQRLDLDLEEADLEETLRSFGKILQTQGVDLDPEVTGRITLHLENVRVETALNAVCESAGCAWILGHGVLTVHLAAEDRAAAEIGLDERVDIDLADADVQETLQALGRILRVPVSVDPALDGRMDVQVQDVPIRQLLDQICKIEGCRWELSGGADPVLRFTSAGGG